MFGKVYIGQSVNILKRINGHKGYLKNNKHHSIHLQRAWNKYGSSNFTFELIEECEKIHLDEKEIYWISNYDSCNYNKGYNSETGGNIDKDYSLESKQRRLLSANKRMTDDVKQKISDAHKGKILSEETKIKLSEAHTGMEFSDTHKLNISKARNGMKFSEKHKNNLRLSKLNKSSGMKISVEQAIEIRNKYSTGKYKHSDLAIEYSVSLPTISSVINCTKGYKINKQPDLVNKKNK